MNDETASDLAPVEVESLPAPGELPGVIRLLGELKPGAILTEEGVAHLFNRHVASVKRAVQRGEFPFPAGSLVGTPGPPGHWSGTSSSAWRRPPEMRSAWRGR